MNNLLKSLILISFTLIINQVYAANQMDAETVYLKTTLTRKGLCAEKQRCNSPLVASFYKQRNYVPAWTKGDDITKEAVKMLEIINLSYEDGLDPRNYHSSQLNKLTIQIDATDDPERLTKLLVSFDLLLSDAYFQYAYHLHYGYLTSEKLFPYWKAGTNKVDLIKLLNTALDKDNLNETIADLAPHYPGYATLKTKMNIYQKAAIINGNWKSIPRNAIPLEKGDSGKAIALLQDRLLISGELADINNRGKFDKDLEKAVMQFQQNNGLYDDGIIESETLAALNVSIKERIRQMELNLDKMRWLPDNLGNEYVMVNLPEYSLNIIKDGHPTLTMDVAVGGKEHPSCVLVSQINTVVVNPYWSLPTSIAATELWPELKKDKNYLNKKHIQVLQKDSNGNYVEIKANKINWTQLTEKEFNSFRYRQDPGIDNSLGKVKFMFANPCQIYLHDTNESEVFDIYRRDFSHGCIRVSQPRTLADYILTEESNWDLDKVAATFKQEQSKSINLTKPLNIYIVYFTSWVSNDDWVQFRYDIYNYDKESKYPVYLPKRKTIETEDD